MTIDTKELRRKVNSTDIADHIDLHANIQPILVEMIDRLEAAEKEGDTMRTKISDLTINVEYLGNLKKSYEELIGELQDERDALRAKIEAMERQEPDAWAATDETKTVVEALGMNQSRRFDSPLFLAPGAQPRLNEIKITLQRALELGKRQTWTGARKHHSWEEQREEHQCWNKVWRLLGAQGEEK